MGVYTMEASVHFNDVNIENQLTMKGALRLMQEASNCHSNQVVVPYLLLEMVRLLALQCLMC